MYNSPSVAEKKKKSNGVEFHFFEGGISSVNDKFTPYNLTFPTKSKQDLDLTIDEGLVPVKAQLEIYEGNEYTQLAPVFVGLDDNTKEILRQGNAQTKIAISVPDSEYDGNRNRIVIIQPGQDPVAEGSKFGTVVAVMKLSSRKN